MSYGVLALETLLLNRFFEAGIATETFQFTASIHSCKRVFAALFTTHACPDTIKVQVHDMASKQARDTNSGRFDEQSPAERNRARTDGK